MFRKHECATCKAKDQTITLLADLVDWHRAQALPRVGAADPLAGSPLVTTMPAGPAVFSAEPRDLWVSDEEEEIIAALESGAMDSAAGEKALSALQAQNTHIQLVK